MDCSAAFIRDADYVRMEASSWMEIITELPTDSERQYYPLVNYPGRASQASSSTAIGSINADNYNTIYPSGTDVGTMAFSMPVTPTGLLWPFPGVGNISCATVFGEQEAQEASMGYRFFCRFLQYDIVQGYNYVVNSPIMTRG